MRPFFFGMINSGHRVRSNLVHGQTERLARLHIETTSLEGPRAVLNFKKPDEVINQLIALNV